MLPIELTVGSKVALTAFFVIESRAAYNALLGRDWIHSNWCVPSSLHQMLIFWNEDGTTEEVRADNKARLTRMRLKRPCTGQASDHCSSSVKSCLADPQGYRPRLRLLNRNVTCTDWQKSQRPSSQPQRGRFPML